MGLNLSTDVLYDYIQHQQGIQGGINVIQSSQGNKSLSNSDKKRMKSNGGPLDANGFVSKQGDRLSDSYDAYGNKIKQKPWAEYLRQKCAAEGVDYDSVVAQIALESRGDETVTNSAGYTGIFQIGKNEAAAAGMNPKDPKQSIDWYFQNRRKNVNERRKQGIINSGNSALYPKSNNNSEYGNKNSYSTSGSKNELVNNESLPNMSVPLSAPTKIDFDESKIGKSGYNYSQNVVDFRVGNAYSNLQEVGNKMIVKDNIKGAPSLFNDYALFHYHGIKNTNNLFDKIGEIHNERYAGLEWQNPTVSNLIEWGQQPGNRQFQYSWTDFIYCKYFTIIPNNRLITLRRYTHPTYDHGLISSAKYLGKDPDSNQGNYEVSKREDAHQLPVAQAVTWLSEQTENTMSKLLSFTVGMNWDEKTADVNEIRPENQDNQFSGSTSGKIGGIINLLAGKVTKGGLSGEANKLSQYDPYTEDGPLKYKVYGPINVIDKTYVRKRGLNFEQEFEIKFHYNLASHGEINPKMAMLDLMSNLLSLTYNNAKFWGGANRFFPNVPKYPFVGSQQMWFDANPAGWINSVLGDVKTAFGNLTDFFSFFQGNPTNALKNLFSQSAGMLMGDIIGQKERPQILSIPSLLTGQPVGEWHLTIGNPMNPIAMIGNLIIPEDGMKIEFNDILGYDDFPTEMIATIKLKHGRPRDKGDIESMFNQGQGRIYYAYKDQMEPWNRASSTQNSNNSTKGSYSTDGGVSFKQIGNSGEKVSSSSGGNTIDNLIKYSKEFSSDVGKVVYGSKFFTSTDDSDKLAYSNASKNGGGSD